MARRCKHPNWNEPTVNYNPSDVLPTHIRNASTHLIEELVFGISTVTQTCTECGYARSYTVVGRARNKGSN